MRDVFYTDIWMSSAVPASQSNEDSNVASLAASDDTCIATHDHRLLTDVDSWTAALSSGSSNFPGGSILLSDITTNDDADRQSSVIWPASESQSVVDSLQPSITAEHSHIISSVPPLSLQTQTRRVSADSVKSKSISETLSSFASQSEQFGSENRIFPQTFVSPAAAADANSTQVCNVGHTLAKRRSLDNYLVAGNTSEGVVSKQRANSLQNNSGVKNSVDRSGDGRRGDHSFVAPMQRVHHHHHHHHQQQQQSAVSGVGGRMPAMGPSSKHHRAEKLSAENKPVVAKHVTFTDVQVRVKFESSIIIIERKDLGGVMSKDCKNTYKR